jgi:folate-binding protein YgfZ
MDLSKIFYEFRPAADFLVTDEDAADFLQSQFTNDLRPFQSGQCTYGLWLDVKGKVIADSYVLCLGDEHFRVLSERCPATVIAAHLERHIVADEVAITQSEPSHMLELSSAGLRVLDLETPPNGHFSRIEKSLLFLLHSDRFAILSASSDAHDALCSRLHLAGFSALSDAEHGLARMHAGVPTVPFEVGPADLPGEGELERDAVSFTKGCYLGQEVVARMHNIGKPQRRLFIVTGAGPAPVTPIALCNREGKLVGELRTAYSITNENDAAWQGVALLKNRFVEVGDCLHHESMEVSVLRPLRQRQEGMPHG